MKISRFLSILFLGFYIIFPVVSIASYIIYGVGVDILDSIAVFLFFFSFFGPLVALIFPRLFGWMLARTIRLVPGEEIVTKSYLLRVVSLLLLSATVGMMHVLGDAYVEDGFSVGLIFSYLFFISIWAWGLWMLLATPDFGIMYFGMKRDSFSVKSFNNYSLIPGTANLIENDKALFIKTFKIRGKWKVQRGKFLFYKKRSTVEEFTEQVINPSVYGSLGYGEFVGLIRAGSLLSGE